MKKLFFVSIVLLFVLSFFLRAQESIFGNYLFLLDQGRDMLAVKRIVYDHHLTLIGPYTSLQGVFQGPLWYYLLSIPTILFNGNPLGGVILMLIISMTAVFCAYYYSRKLFGISVSFFVLFMFTISPEAIAAATYSWNPHPMWLLVTLYIFFFYQLIQNNVKYHLFLWPILALMFHFQTALGAILFFSTFFHVLIFHRRFFLHRQFIVGIIIAFCFFLPQILFDIRHDFLMSRSIGNLFFGKDQGLFVGGEAKTTTSLITRNISIFYYNFETTILRDGSLRFLPPFFFFTIVFFAINKTAIAFSESKKTFLVFLTRLIIIVGLFSILYPFPLRYWFLTGFQSIYIIYFGIILDKLWSFKVGKIVIGILFVSFLWYAGIRINKLYFMSNDYGGVAKIKGKIDAIGTIYKDAKNKNFNLLVFTPPVSTDPFDYLLWWHGNRKYGYVPTKEKKGTLYLLIESDPDKQWSYKGWLETVIIDGSVMETKQLPSGFIIQRRKI